MHLGDVAQMQVIGPACELKGPDAGHRAHVRVREHARGCAASRADRVAVIAIVRGSDGSWARLLAVLTLPCAAKAHWWHGGQPAQDTTYRVNVRTGGPTLHLSGERAHEGAQVAVCWLRYGRLRLRLRLRGRLRATREPSAFVRVQQRPARTRAGRCRTQQSGVLQYSLHGEHEDHHDRVVEGVEQPRVGDVFPGLHVHEGQDDAERQV